MMRVVLRLIAPALLAIGAVGARAGDTVTVPVEIVKNVPLLEVEIAGRGPFTMLLDTGVTPSAIDLDAARGLAGRLFGEAQAEPAPATPSRCRSRS